MSEHVQEIIKALRYSFDMTLTEDEMNYLEGRMREAYEVGRKDGFGQGVLARDRVLTKAENGPDMPSTHTEPQP